MRVISSIILLAAASGKPMISAQEQQANNQRSASLRIRVLLANPASTNCIDNGGCEQNLYDVDGNQWAVCSFADGSACEEWAFLRGECSKGGTVAFITDCEKKNGVYKGHHIDSTNVNGAIQGFYYTCQYTDGSICFEEDYYKGECG
jgi:putative hemolysin